MEKVSIVVPVYNVEDYLKYCVDSLINQSYKNIEIILVDDGSTDDSGRICDEYAQEDDRVRVLHIENGGLSNARNTGVNVASAEWVIFIDSDDYYDRRTVEYLVQLQKKYAVDLVATSVIEVRDFQSDDFIGSLTDIDSLKLDRYTALKEMFYGNIVGTHPGGKLYKKEILMKFPFPKGMIYEDLAVSFEHIGACNEIAVGYINLYKYYRRPGSIVNSSYSDKFLDFYKAIELNREYVERDYPNDQEMKKALTVRYVFKGLHVVHALLGSQMYEQVNKIRKEYRRYWKDILINSHITRKNKLKYLLLLLSPHLYQKVRAKLG
ncbi:glycosyltransferase [Streptococcus parasanguinis]|jgi:putative glycosyltransferase|uniref:Glycosyltransferase n=1 Tax=Streptococcus gingivalis TaxID=3111861 RepID=A0ABU6B9D1_9STRE|nr:MULTISPECIES: glycosyltransferase family 2 protein [Streptococcus]MBZ2079324.1 glycosyltransferase [Streptococcus parasanguinis]MCP8991016.1 glycosyltransferase [Streptococcus parasanguinis]MCP8992984.1 glycosyltransferase [Streptococcus parasanguinis]MCP9004011.1 glycosyltransferase [Streptococcus parasanguinis]MCP9010093.1 glycosyltransferase [Streptococcus parasanguinis]